MSSEEERAEERALVRGFDRHYAAMANEQQWQHPTHACLPVREAIHAYKEHIERRVLAQQPCYGAWSNGKIEHASQYYTCKEMDVITVVDHPGEWPRGSRCPSCKARDDTARAAQTHVEQGNAQETSG